MSAGLDATIRVEPQVEFPGDSSLAELERAFDGGWVWDAYCRKFGQPAASPQVLRIRQFNHTPGRGATIGYVVDWAPDAYLPPQDISLRVVRGRPAEISRYPDDRALPGLANAARPNTALGLVNRHVLKIPARRIKVEAVRYRPGSRAVLRHTIGKVTFYVRVVRPASASALISAAERIVHSDFAAPRLAGQWSEGGVVWLSEIPGRNVRRFIRRGGKPEPERLLDGLASLWEMSGESDTGHAFDLGRRYRQAKRILRHAANGHADLRDVVRAATLRLDPFVASWRPAGMAHNDFYDDQMLELPDGRIALVDFEELGPGDPMLDVGNFLAHQRVQAGLGSERVAAGVGAYRAAFRRAALDRCGWDAPDLDLREAVCLFRICTSIVRNISADWRERLSKGVRLVNELLD